MLGPGVRVEKGATVRDSVILNDTVIAKGAVIERAIIDKHAHIGPGCRIGAKGEGLPLAVVGKGSTLPDGFVVHPGGEVAHDVIPSDLEGSEVPDGLSVHTKRRPWEVGR